MSDSLNIPEGWTYFAHRTNTDKWDGNPIDNGSIHIKKIMSAITENDIKQDVRHYGKGNIKGYSIGKGKPFEIRCLIPSLAYVRSFEGNDDIQNIVLNEYYFDKNNFGGARGQRHPSIPKGEELILIEIGNYDEIYENESTIIWTIPKRLMEFYKSELSKNNNREISLINPMLKQYQEEFDDASEHIDEELLYDMEFMQLLHNLHQNNPFAFLEEHLGKTIATIQELYVTRKEMAKKQERPDLDKNDFVDRIDDDIDEIF